MYTLSYSNPDITPEDCDEGNIMTKPGSNPPIQCCIEGENECPITSRGQSTKLINDEIECGENYSCCLCSEILCTPNCDKFVAGGDSSAFGVMVTINGNKDDSAKIECNGDHSCQDSEFMASYISELNCGGDHSCQRSKISINDGSVENIICGGDFACESAEIIISNPAEDFQIECKEPSSCDNIMVTIIIPRTSSVTEFKGFGCGGPSACQNAKFTIVNENMSGNNLNVEQLNCEASAACRGAIFSFIGNVEIEECKCGSQGGCLGAIGISDCFQNLDKLECKDTACIGSDEPMIIMNPTNDFELICENCKGAKMKIVIDDNAEDGPIRNIKSIKCGECENVEIIISNQQRRATINVEKIECKNGDNTCNNAMFSREGKVNFNEIECESGSCNGCKANGKPC